MPQERQLADWSSEERALRSDIGLGMTACRYCLRPLSPSATLMAPSVTPAAHSIVY